MPTKAFPVLQMKAGEQDGLAPGQFEALVSVFGNVDRHGDVVIAGAFADSLKAWEESGDPIPVLWSHMASDPEYHIGWVLKAEEREPNGDTPGGLWVRGEIDTNEPKSSKVYRLLKGRRVKQWSFAYDIVEASWGKRDDQDVYELRKLDVLEVGPTMYGANSETRLLGVKAGQTCPTCGATKASKAPATEPAKDVKSEEPTRCSPADVRLLADLAEAGA